MSFSSPSGQVVLQEVFDEGSIPTDEEVIDYAIRIGIDVENEPHLLYLARDGLMQALPLGWKPCYDRDKKEIYYFNFKTKKAQWDHPLDDVYKNLVRKTRSDSVFSEQVDDDSRTSIREDLKSFEEASLILRTNDMNCKVKKLEPMSPLGKGHLKKFTAALSPSRSTKELLSNASQKPTLHVDEDKLLVKLANEDPQKKILYDETEVRKRPNSSDIRNRRNIGPMELRQLAKQEIIVPHALEKLNLLIETKNLLDNKLVTEFQSIDLKCGESKVIPKDEGYGTEFSVSSLGEKDGSGKKELTLAGGGTIFLKSNKVKFSPSSDLVTSSFSKEELSDGLLSPEGKKTLHDTDPYPKSILRDHTHLKINEKFSTDQVEKIRKEELEDERKSVRFNLEEDLKISFEISPSLNNESMDLSKVVKNNSSVMSDHEKQQARQIELDFDELNICLSDEKFDNLEQSRMPLEIVKAVQPKKFRPSQMLVNEFREIIDNKVKNNLREVTKTENSTNENTELGPRCNIRRTINQKDDIYHSKQDVNENIRISQLVKSGDLSKSIKCSISKNEKVESKTLDSTFDELVEFAIKKKLNVDASKNDDAKSSTLDIDKSFALDEILKGNESDSEEESDIDKIFVANDKEFEYLEKLESEINFKVQGRRELDEDIINSEKLKNDKQNELEREYKLWVKNVEDSYKEKRSEALNSLKEKFECWVKEKESEFEKTYKDKYDKEIQSRIKELKNELLKKESFEVETLKNELDLQQKERLKNIKAELEIQEAKELNSLQKSFEHKLNEKKAELTTKHKEEISVIERNLEDLWSEKRSHKLKELELVRENETLIEAMRLEMKESYQKQKNNLMKEHELLLQNIKQEHDVIIEELRKKLKNEEDILKRNHLTKMEDLKTLTETTAEKKKDRDNDIGTEMEGTESKVRSEKRLLEDKYKTLREKYLKLKAEAKSTLERKTKKKETSVATCSDTEKSSSYKGISLSEKNNSSLNPDRRQDKEKKMKTKINNFEYIYQDVSTEDEDNLMSLKDLSQLQKSLLIAEPNKKHLLTIEKPQLRPTSSCKKLKEFSGEEKKMEVNETKKKRQLFSRFKAVSTSKISMNSKNQLQEVLSPVENLRRQLKKLEELEDQFPVTTYTDTYMRYPFTDNAQFGSSEIEFFKHRIHLERESVRRAKTSLKAQKRSCENRQRELQQKLVECVPGSKATIDQMYQEEKELTDMEVSVYKTRALLGEKIIRLRHLEQSLKRISQPLKKGKEFLENISVRTHNKDDDRTLSDLSSYSGSSGFSSTDFNDGNKPIVSGGIKIGKLEKNRHTFQCNMQESSEIIKSLESLNSEIREIWDVLKKQHQSGQETIAMLPPPPQLGCNDLGSGCALSPNPFRNTVITSYSNLQRPIAQQYKTQVTGNSQFHHLSTIIDATLMDRTKSLREWLKAAKNSTSSEAMRSSQITL